jgi:hypothetical protein
MLILLKSSLTCQQLFAILNEAMKRKCKNCGKFFSVNHPHRKYCLGCDSRKRRDDVSTSRRVGQVSTKKIRDAKKTRETLPHCQWCNKRIPKAKNSKQQRRVSCSDKCQIKMDTRRGVIKKQEKNKSKYEAALKIKITCKNCKETFFPKPNQCQNALAGNLKFCSEKCRSDHHAGLNIARGKAIYDRGRSKPKVCVVCKETFIPLEVGLQKNSTVCSNECREEKAVRTARRLYGAGDMHDKEKPCPVCGKDIWEKIKVRNEKGIVIRTSHKPLEMAKAGVKAKCGQTFGSVPKIFCSSECQQKSAKVRVKEEAEKITDEYVRRMIHCEFSRQGIKMSKNKIPQFLVEMKREELLFARKVKEIKKNG